MSLTGIKSLITYRQFNEPSSPSVGDLWSQENSDLYSNYKPTIKVWNGTSWVIIIQGNAPGSYGYWAGGYDGGSIRTSVDRLEFPFDSGITSRVANLSKTSSTPGGCNSSIYGYCTSSSPSISQIERFQFPFDSGLANYISNTATSVYYNSSCNSSIHGYNGSGLDASNNNVSSIYRFQFPFDTSGDSKVGNLASSKNRIQMCNSSTYGYTAGGYVQVADIYLSSVDKFPFPFDSGTGSHTSNLANSVSGNSMCNSSLNAYSLGGQYSGNKMSYVFKLTFPFDSGTASQIGNLSSSRYYSTGLNSSKYGFVGGGQNASVTTSYVDRIEFPFNSGTTILVGNFQSIKESSAGIDSTDFITQFV